MKFQKGNQHGKKSKRGKDVLKKELKEKLKEHVDTVLDSMDIDSYTENQKLKYLSTVLPYVVSKQKAVAIDNDLPDLPLFLDDLPKEVSKHLKEKWYNQVRFVE
jgi:hypothetical protein